MHGNRESGASSHVWNKKGRYYHEQLQHNALSPQCTCSPSNYKKRGSASYIVGEVRSVRERDTERERERESETEVTSP